MKETIKAVLDKIEKLNKKRCIVAIDGRCNSGKSIFAKELSGIQNCSVAKNGILKRLAYKKNTI